MQGDGPLLVARLRVSPQHSKAVNMGWWWQSWGWVSHFLIKRRFHLNSLSINLEDGLDSPFGAGFLTTNEEDEEKESVYNINMSFADGEAISERIYRCFRAYEWLVRIGTFRFPICDFAQAYTGRGEQDPPGVLTNMIRLLPLLPPYLRGSRNHKLLQEAALLMLCQGFAVAEPMRVQAFQDCLTVFSVVSMTANDLYLETTALINCMPLHQPDLTVLEVATEACHDAGGSTEIQFASIGCLSFIMRCCEACTANPLSVKTMSEAYTRDVGTALSAVALGLVAAVERPPKAIIGSFEPRVANLRLIIFDCIMMQQASHFRLGCYGRSTSPHSRIVALENVKTALALVTAETSSPVTVMDII